MSYYLVRHIARSFGFCLALVANLACSSGFNTSDASRGGSPTGDGGRGGAGGTGSGMIVGVGATGDTGGMSGSAPDGGMLTETCTPPATISCWEASDGTPFTTPMPEVAQGACKIGERRCNSDGTWGQCLGAVEAQPTDACDVPGNDGDCNGVLNEGCPCTNDETQACGTDAGNCEKGTQTCVGGQWGACVGEVAPEAVDTCAEGDDADCNEVPNENCECINGQSQECGSAVGNCEKGTQTCQDGVWGPCEGEVQAEAADTCVAADDADCDGSPNEGCDCTDGQTRGCGDTCGMQSCGTDHTWETCSGGGECTVGEVQTDTVVCGNCGSQARRRTCGSECAWGDWENVGACIGQGECAPGGTPQQHTVPCGTKCGAQTETRTCTATCSWGAWTPVGTCTGEGSCSPGAVQAASSVACGACNGTQARRQVCNSSCGWNNPEPVGMCLGDGAIRCDSSDIKKRQICGDGGAWLAHDQCTGDCRQCSNGTCVNSPAGVAGPGCSGQCQTCQAGASCATATATTCYTDGDRDGYGKPGTGVTVCGACSTGQSTNATDCYDNNVNARPDQTAYFSVHRGDNSFDYNCNSATTVANGDITSNSADGGGILVCVNSAGVKQEDCMQCIYSFVALDNTDCGKKRCTVFGDISVTCR